MGFEGMVMTLPFHNNHLGRSSPGPTSNSRSLLLNSVTILGLIYCKGVGGRRWGTLNRERGQTRNTGSLRLTLRHLMDSRLLVAFYSRSNSLVTGDHTSAGS